MATSPDYKKVKREVKRLLDRYVNDAPPIDPKDIAQKLGIKVKFVRFDEELKEKISGFYDPDSNTIYINEEEYPLRQTFTIAHELGHALLHKEWSKSGDYRIMLRKTKSDSDPYEKEANAFAANLLVPRDLLGKYLSLPIDTLSEIFAVSVPVIKNRLCFEYGIDIDDTCNSYS